MMMSDETKNFDNQHLLAFWAIISTVLIFILYQISGLLLHGALNSKDNDYLLPYIQAFSQLLFLLLPVILISLRFPLEFREMFRLKQLPTSRQLLFAVTAMAGFQFFVAGYSIIQERLIPESFLEDYQALHEMIRETYLKYFSGSGTLDIIRSLVVGAVIPAVSEEFLFRGFLQRSLEERMRPTGAILIAGVMFSLLHFNPIDFVALACIGLFLGFLAYYTKSIVLCIIIHFLNNAFAISVLFSTNSDEVIASESMSIELALIFTLSGLALCLIMLFLLYKEHHITTIRNSLVSDD